MTVEAPGFKKLQRSGLEVDANGKMSLGNISLEVGTLSESVEITGADCAAANRKCGAGTTPTAGGPGSARILQTMIRIQF